MKPYVIGLDIGTGSIKGSAIERSGRLIGIRQQHYQPFISHEGNHELDPDVLLEAMVKTIAQLSDQTGRAPAAISLSSAMHGIMAVDGKGKPLTRLITWLDNRSASFAQELRKDPVAVRLYRETGTPVHAMTPLCKIAWLREHSPDIFSKASRFLSIKEYLWFKLFGTFEIDHSLASATGLFDIRKKTWHPEALDIAGITKDRLSIPVPTNTLRQRHSQGLWSAQVITEETSFCIGGSDGCLAMPGSGAMKEGYGAISVGTSAAVRAVHASPMQNEQARNFCYVLDDAHYVCGCPLNNGGNVADWLMQTFLPGQTIDSFFEKTSHRDSLNTNPIFLPYLFGERAPVWNEAASGAFIGIRSWHKPEDFVEAGFEGICFALKQQLLILERFSRPFLQLQASGGFTRSKGWVQLLSDITGKPVAFNSEDDASARGAALLAMKAMGWMADYPDAAPNEEIVKPRISHTEAYENTFKRFCAIYPAIEQI